jgi:hypothetical protein
MDEVSYKEWAWKEKVKKAQDKEDSVLKPKKERYSYKNTQVYKDRLQVQAEYRLGHSNVQSYVKIKNRPIVSTSKKEFDFLKYYRVVIYWASRQYDASRADIELMFYLYNEKPFTKSQFEDFAYIMVWDKKRFDNYLEKGWIEEYAKKGELGRINSIAIYKLSFQWKRRIKAIYDRLTFRNLISEEGKNTKIFQKKVGYQDKRYSKVIKEMNEQARAMRDGTSEYYLEEDLKYV